MPLDCRLAAVKTLAGFILAALAGALAAQPRDPCMEAYNAEVVRIEREAKARQQAGSDAEKQRRARAAESQTKAATKRAQQCQAEAKAAPAAAKPPATEAECNAQASERLAEIERRHAGGGSAAQAGRGEEELKVRADLMECTRRPR